VATRGCSELRGRFGGCILVTCTPDGPEQRPLGGSSCVPQTEGGPGRGPELRVVLHFGEVLTLRGRGLWEYGVSSVLGGGFEDTHVP
jgi:hypothetical protein